MKTNEPETIPPVSVTVQPSVTPGSTASNRTTTVSAAPATTMQMDPAQTNAATAPRRNHQRRRQARRWLPYVGAVLVIALIVAGLWPQPVPVEIAQASIGLLRTTVNEEGKTRIRQRYTVSAPVMGQLRRIPFKAGAEVKAGETILAVIDPLTPAMLDERSRSAAAARRDAAAANVERARATRQFAENELRRTEKLAAEKTVSPQELEYAQWRATSAEKELAAAESTLREAEVELAEFTTALSGAARTPVEVKSPASGRVLRVFEESARVVASGAPLLEVGDPSDLEAVIEVLSRDGAAIQPGAKVELEQWGGSEPLQGRVRLVEPAAFTKVSALGVEEQRVNVVVDIVTPVEQRGSLGDQFRVEGRIITSEIADALKAPSGAVFRRGQRSFVFVLRDGRAQLRPVTIGRSSGVEVQILDGLKEGDEVIVYPGDRVNSGQRVRPIQVSID